MLKQIRFGRVRVFILLFLFATTCLSQNIKSFSLQEAKEYALENNHDIRDALLEIKGAHKQLWEVTAQGFPQIESSARYQYLVDIPTQLIPGEIFGQPGTTIPVKFGKPHNASYGISASQLIFSGSYFVGVQASRIFLKLSEENLERTETDLKATLTNTYHLILIAEENRRVLQETLENLQKTKYEISEMYKQGFTEKTDVKQLQISVNELENNIRALDEQIEISYQLLKLQMGLPLDEQIALKDDLDSFIEDTNYREQLQRPFDPYNNINLKAMQTQEHLRRLSLKKEKTTFLPTIAAFATWQRDAQRDEFNLFDKDETWYPTTVVGVQLSWPIFNGSAKFHKIQRARVELRRARIMKDKVEQGLTLEYKSAHSELSTALDRYKTAEMNRDLARDVYEITLEKYREGMSTSLDLTQTHNQYLNSEGKYLQTISDLLSAETKLEKILQTL
jgi:outer membrane protein TolC